MTIGRLAAAAGVAVPTLRYYERLGLLREPGRRASGYRDYPDEAVRVVRFIRHAQTLGFTLTDISQLLELAAGGGRDCRAVKALASVRIGEMNRKIRMLESMSSSLARLIETCDRPRRRRDCPLLDAIESSAR
jgi:DNA-binding transcriptional MerR regulator